MSDMMQGAPTPQSAMDAKASVFNPADMARKVTKGDVRPDQTVGEFLVKNFGVRPEDPVQKLFQNIKGQVQNRTAAGKVGMAPQGQMPQRPMTQRPAQPVGGMDDLINRL